MNVAVVSLVVMVVLGGSLVGCAWWARSVRRYDTMELCAVALIALMVGWAFVFTSIT